MQKYIPVVIISIIVAIFTIIIIIIFLNSSNSTTTVSSTAGAITAPNNSTPAPAPLPTVYTIKKELNTTEVINSGGTMYYLLCITNTGNVSGVITAIDDNNSLSGNYVGNFHYWDNMVSGMLDELGSGVTIGSSADLVANFTDLGYLCTQNSISSLNTAGDVYTIKSSDSTTTDATSLLDYISAIYVADGILIPPKPKFSYNYLVYPAYQTKKSTSSSWTLIPTATIGTNNSLYVSGINMYDTQFILLKTTGNTVLDKSLKSQGYYANTGVWDTAASRMVSGNLAAGTLLLSPSLFPPFTIIPN